MTKIRYVTVSPIGFASDYSPNVKEPNNGADFGPDSPRAGSPSLLSSTSGIQEALNFAASSTTSGVRAPNPEVVLISGGSKTTGINRTATFQITGTIQWPAGFAGTLKGADPWRSVGSGLSKTTGTVVSQASTSAPISALLQIGNGSASASGFEISDVSFYPSAGLISTGGRIVDLRQRTTGGALNDASHEIRVIRCTFEDSTTTSGAAYALDMSGNQDSVLAETRVSNLPARWVTKGVAKIRGGFFNSGIETACGSVEFLSVTFGANQPSADLSKSYYVHNATTSAIATRFMKFENCASNANKTSLVAHLINNGAQPPTPNPLRVSMVGGKFNIALGTTTGKPNEFFHSSTTSGTASYDVDVYGTVFEAIQQASATSTGRIFTPGSQYKILRWQSVSFFDPTSTVLNNNQKGVGNQNSQKSLPGASVGASLLPEAGKFYRASGIINLTAAGSASFQVMVRYLPVGGSYLSLEVLNLFRGTTGASATTVAGPVDRFYFQSHLFRAWAGTSGSNLIQVFTGGTTSQGATYDFESVIEEVGG